LAAFGESTFERKSSNREGVVNLEAKNAELLLITLEKTEANYSPTTLYNDYAVSAGYFTGSLRTPPGLKLARGSHM
jgi:hypothetical protein